MSDKYGLRMIPKLNHQYSNNNMIDLNTACKLLCHIQKGLRSLNGNHSNIFNIIGRVEEMKTDIQTMKGTLASIKKNRANWKRTLLESELKAFGDKLQGIITSLPDAGQQNPNNQIRFRNPGLLSTQAQSPTNTCLSSSEYQAALQSLNVISDDACSILDKVHSQTNKPWLGWMRKIMPKRMRKIMPKSQHPLTKEIAALKKREGPERVARTKKPIITRDLFDQLKILDDNEPNIIAYMNQLQHQYDSNSNNADSLNNKANRLLVNKWKKFNEKTRQPDDVASEFKLYVVLSELLPTTHQGLLPYVHTKPIFSKARVTNLEHQITSAKLSKAKLQKDLLSGLKNNRNKSVRSDITENEKKEIDKKARVDAALNYPTAFSILADKSVVDNFDNKPDVFDVYKKIADAANIIAKKGTRYPYIPEEESADPEYLGYLDLQMEAVSCFYEHFETLDELRKLDKRVDTLLERLEKYRRPTTLLETLATLAKDTHTPDRHPANRIVPKTPKIPHSNLLAAKQYFKDKIYENKWELGVIKTGSPLVLSAMGLVVGSLVIGAWPVGLGIAGLGLCLSIGFGVRTIVRHYQFKWKLKEVDRLIQNNSSFQASAATQLDSNPDLDSNGVINPEAKLERTQEVQDNTAVPSTTLPDTANPVEANLERTQEVQDNTAVPSTTLPDTAKPVDVTTGNYLVDPTKDTTRDVTLSKSVESKHINDKELQANHQGADSPNFWFGLFNWDTPSHTTLHTDQQTATDRVKSAYNDLTQAYRLQHIFRTPRSFAECLDVKYQDSTNTALLVAHCRLAIAYHNLMTIRDTDPTIRDTDPMKCKNQVNDWMVYVQNKQEQYYQDNPLQYWMGFLDSKEKKREHFLTDFERYQKTLHPNFYNHSFNEKYQFFDQYYADA